ncbi:hypothetical protein [Poseidonibacter ostreae]|uniref:Uncharacterized protein n=1 Tax=Poseidonibacter ostreae TaxID=2654171 RepID=A0A6L4WX11_9BACT|nr:hypothetical protein [Poseidonibacter ostreae]KAB7891385.1 hypothetical protein GBG19_00685 [Poseidonibacter ostreae]
MARVKNNTKSISISTDGLFQNVANVGDIVYTIKKGLIVELRVCEVLLRIKKNKELSICYKDIEDDIFSASTIFLTREHAEKYL